MPERGESVILPVEVVFKETCFPQFWRIGASLAVISIFGDPSTRFSRIDDLKQIGRIEIRLAMIVEHPIVIRFDPDHEIGLIRRETRELRVLLLQSYDHGTL